jgi:surface polysaccharide O-acyltransferase-like enzyme
MQRTTQRDAWADTARVIAAVLVVAIHVAQYWYWHPPTVAGWGVWWVAVTICILGRTAVPLFTFLSGWYVLGGRRYGWRAFYAKRAWRLLVPLLVWRAIYAATEPFEFWSAGPYRHLYFLWALLGLMAVTPLLRPLLDRARFWQIACGLLVWLALVSLPITNWYGLRQRIIITIAVYPLRLLGYYVLGYLWRRRRWRLAPVTATAMLATGLGIALLGWWGHTVNFRVPLNTYIPLEALALCGLVGLLQRVPANGLASLGPGTYGVYLMHRLVLDAIPLGGDRVTWLTLIAVSAGIAALCFALAYLWRRSSQCLRRACGIGGHEGHERRA